MITTIEALKKQRIWVCHNYPNKIPVRPDGKPVRVNDPETWSTYEECLAAGTAGVGFVITRPYIGVDLDWKDWEGDGIPKYAQDIIDRQMSYTEASPSGKGAHIICTEEASGTPITVKEKGLEVYSGGRYFTYTGKRIGAFSSFAPLRRSLYIRGTGTGTEDAGESTGGSSPGVPASASGLVVSSHKTKLASLDNYSGRNDHLTSIAGFLRENFLLSPEELEKTLPLISAHLHAAHKDGPLPMREVAAISRSIGSRPAETASITPVPELTPWTMEGLMDTEIPKRKYFAGIAGTAIFTSHSINQVFAFRGTGKTMFQFALALSIAGGKNFLCYNVPAARRVLYVEGELPDNQIQERVKSLGVPELARDNMLILSRDRQLEHGTDIPSIHTAQGRSAIEQVLDKCKAEVLFLDSMSSLLQLGTNEEDSWLEVLPWFMRLRSRGLCVIITQQTGKDQTRGNRGHSRSEDPLDVSIQLTRRDEECEYLNCLLTYTKFRAGSAGVKPIVLTKEEGKDWAWATLLDATKTEIREILDKDPGTSSSAIVDLLGGNRKKMLRVIQEVRDEKAIF